MSRQFIRIQSTDRVTSQLQDNIARAFGPLLENVTAESQLLTGIVLTAGQTNRIAHRLGRRLTGYIVVRKSAFADIADDASNASPELTLWLNTTSDVTVNLLVF